LAISSRDPAIEEIVFGTWQGVYAIPMLGPLSCTANNTVTRRDRTRVHVTTGASIVLYPAVGEIRGSFEQGFFKRIIKVKKNICLRFNKF
jgi:hypothetical protein